MRTQAHGCEVWGWKEEIGAIRERVWQERRWGGTAEVSIQDSVAGCLPGQGRKDLWSGGVAQL